MKLHLRAGLLMLTALCSIPFTKANANNERPTEKVGCLYIQTNGVKNEIIHYARMSDGDLKEVQRIATGGAGSGSFKPVTGHDGEPNPFEGVKSVILSSDHKWLFTTNGGDNSVSVFSVAPDGTLTFSDMQKTGQPVKGKSGTAKSLAYNEAAKTLYVCHTFGPDHIRMFTVRNGKLSRKEGSYTVNTASKTDRLPTEVILSPDNRFLLVDILFDKRPGMKPDGMPDLAVANMKDKDGLVVFPVMADGNLGAAMFTDAGGEAPFDIAFLHGSNNKFINSYAGSGGVAMCMIDGAGRVTCQPVVKIDQEKGMPNELCWVQITPDNKQIFATVFGYSSVSSFMMEGDNIKLNRDPASDPVPGDGKFKSLNMRVSSGPNDSWLSADGKLFYQLYPNASKLNAYRVTEGGKLKRENTKEIPYTSPQGMAGF